MTRARTLKNIEMRARWFKNWETTTNRRSVVPWGLTPTEWTTAKRRVSQPCSVLAEDAAAGELNGLQKEEPAREAVAAAANNVNKAQWWNGQTIG